MEDPSSGVTIITGASRGIGRALALELMRRPGGPLVLTARDRDALADLAARRAGGRRTTTIAADLSRVAGARELAAAIAGTVTGGATLVSNAGIWPARRELTGEGLERAFAVNAAAPVALAGDLLERGVVSRVLAVGAGLMIKGRVDPERTPAGEDFSSFRTYCTTKLALAVAMRDLAGAHPEADVAVVHPGVVQTALGDRSGALGALLRVAKRRWEDPAVTGSRLADLLERERWSEPGDAQWFAESDPQSWPAVCDDPATRDGARRALART